MSGPTPYELVRSNFEFPPKVEDRDFQIEWVNALAPLPRSGHWAEVGTGKTFVATCCALYKKLISKTPVPAIVVMPPILTRQWKRWLESITDKRTRKPLTCVEYKGTPTYRRGLDLRGDFVVMGIQIFKKDFQYLWNAFEHMPMVFTVDEATSIKNVESENFRRVRDFTLGRDLQLLTGTPLSKPADAYAYIKLISPQVYRNLNHFEALHVEERDFFGNVVKWAELDFLRENLLLNSVRVLKEKAMPYLKRPLYDVRPYALEPEHQALYNKLADEQILILEDGGKIDATQTNRLYNMLQQIVCNPGYFSGDPNMRSAAHEMLDQTLDELLVDDPVNGEKLIVSANYRMTNRGLVEYLKPYGAVAIFGEVSEKRQQQHKEQFVDDAQCRVMIVQPSSGGYGTDGWQQVCSNEIFMEAPTIPRDFHQVVGRIDRDGQTKAPHIRMPMAERTIQLRLHKNLLDSDKLVNRVQGGFKDLREAIYGEPEVATEEAR